MPDSLPGSHTFASLMEARTHVLLVEDNPADRRLVAEYLRALPGMRLESCERLDEALARVANGTYDCALLDLSLPDAQGLESVEQLRVAAPDLPLVVLTGNSDESLALRAMQFGAQDYLAKDEVDARTLARSLRYAIERQRAELRIQHLALHDPLTGLANRRLFGERLEQALARRARNGGDVAVLFADLDGFKSVNDAYGHAAGDELLCQVAGRLQLAVRTTDTVGRLGGDEFAVLCENVGSERTAAAVAERIIHAIESPFVVDDGRARVELSLSIGLACAEGEDAIGADLLRRSDAAMYAAKRENSKVGT
jgi:diguanylate cyclase (GGDEF)-like protein